MEKGQTHYYIILKAIFLFLLFILTPWDTQKYHSPPQKNILKIKDYLILFIIFKIFKSY